MSFYLKGCRVSYLIMKHLFVPYELAVKLKEKGFNKPCLKSITETGFDNNYSVLGAKDWNILNDVTSIPLYQQVLDWLDEEYDLFFVENHRMNGNVKNYWYNVSRFKKSPHGSENLIGMIGIGCALSKNEALKKAIDEVLKLLKKIE